MAFDQVDRQLLELVQQDGRIKLSELGRRVRLSPAAVAERLRRLEASGAVTGYGARVDPARLGYGIQAFVRVDPHGGYTLRHPRGQELLARPELVEAHHVVGEDCWILKVAVTDTLHLEEILGEISALGRTTTSVVLSSPLGGLHAKPLLPPEA
ncbi:Lrp/AsnC family transcriptional regulator [Streptomyces sp. WAC06614]|uniref:Lrp/AsnC family transcriptional regulator n=1 Tax=Streptomyces sp. WAC06614 TaxID=2487416 RepID=UPI000F7AB49D|nr:Lrp/AsnC family transcriptional regulator [Streptomyces sp. WAC06614]RSS54808.1 Lrp/AsnC family transcriptional regulator [Streptomyces sp. WAC06614]